MIPADFAEHGWLMELTAEFAQHARQPEQHRDGEQQFSDRTFVKGGVTGGKDEMQTLIHKDEQGSVTPKSLQAQ